jgi:hypothetical protein
MAASAVVSSCGNDDRIDGAGVARSTAVSLEPPMALIYAPCWREARDFDPGTRSHWL